MPGDGVEGRGWWRTAGWQGGELLKREDGLGSLGWALAGLQSGVCEARGRGDLDEEGMGDPTATFWTVCWHPGYCSGIQGG